jgi:uncharacterized protein with PIN domain
MNGEPSQEVHFIADAMLGRLARWLRLLGFDTLYDPRISDRDLLRCALREGRTLLTRDTHFLHMKNLTNLFFVRSNDPREQVKEVLGAFPVKQQGPGRCSRCNGILTNVDERDSVEDIVPEFVFLRGGDFLRCGACGGVYWEGTHLRRFRAMLGTLFQGGKGEVRTQE